MALRPIGEHIIVESDEMETKTPAGLYFVGDATESALTGTIVSIGKKVSAPINVGNRIVFGKYSGTSFSHEDKALLIMRASDIYAVIE